jgi:hypothetical protein
MWIEAHYFDYGANDRGIKNSGNFGIVYVGADYLVTRSWLVGVLAQVDTMSEKSSTLGSSVGGQGILAGPYTSVRLTSNIFFDARAAWGVSGDRVTPFGTYTDGFNTDRWLARANLTGNWRFGNFRVTPTASVIYAEENQHSYVDSLGVLIPGQTVALGRFTIWPEFAYRFLGSDGTIWEPHVTLKGNWDFKRPAFNGGLPAFPIGGIPAFNQINGIIVTGDEFSAGVEAGLLAIVPHGWSLRTAVTYDGVGSSHFHALGGKVWLNRSLY